MAAFLQSFSSHSLDLLQQHYSVYTQPFEPVTATQPCQGIADDGFLTVTLNLSLVHGVPSLTMYNGPGGSITDETVCSLQNCGAAGNSVYTSMAFGGTLMLDGIATVSCPAYQLFTTTDFQSMTLHNSRLVLETIFDTTYAKSMGTSSLYTLTGRQQVLTEFRYESWSTTISSVLSTTNFDAQNVDDPYAALQLTLFASLSSAMPQTSYTENRLQARIYELSQDAVEVFANNFAIYVATANDKYFSWIRDDMYWYAISAFPNPIAAPAPFVMPQFDPITSLSTLTSLPPNNFGGCVSDPRVTTLRVGPHSQYNGTRRAFTYT